MPSWFKQFLSSRYLSVKIDERYVGYVVASLTDMTLGEFEVDAGAGPGFLAATTGKSAFDALEALASLLAGKTVINCATRERLEIPTGDSHG